LFSESEISIFDTYARNKIDLKLQCLYNKTQITIKNIANYRREYSELYVQLITRSKDS